MLNQKHDHRIQTRFNPNDSWHSDVSFEPAPASFSILKFEEIPESGGNTIWSNGYELYDNLSPSIKTLLEGLTATHSSDVFKLLVETYGRKTFGPLNNSVHPVIRTNPVTGWKSVFTNPIFTREINEVSPSESKWILGHLNDLVARNLQYQVRFNWEKNSVAIWDNRSTFHAGVPDFKPYHRRGVRVTVLGEIPFFDPNSGTQAKAWEATAKAIIAKQDAAEKAKADTAEKAKDDGTLQLA
jgi:sulfonate dioxygenase